ncbi:MAG: FtsX-like permease family protein [Bacteroidota bacterium]
MNLSLKIARRYLFAKKSTNAINVITGISVFGIAVGTAALILILSVFNGFEDLISDLSNSFNPDVKVTPVQGKYFVPGTEQLAQLRAVEGVEGVSETIEEVAFFDNNGSKTIGRMKGVDQYFQQVTRIDSTIRDGRFRLHDDELGEMAVFGYGMQGKLAINLEDYLSKVSVFTAKRKGNSRIKPFNQGLVKASGSFFIQQEVDQEYVLTSLDFARRLLEFKDEVSALEIKVDPTADQEQLLSRIRSIMGENFHVKDRYHQNEAFLKLMNMEKWMSAAILSLTLVLVAFNLVGSLWMIVLDKRKDISILQSMGATRETIRNIFLNEGLLLSLLGILIGTAIAMILYVLQKTVGIVSIGPGFLVDTYPVSMRLFDLLVVALIVITIGLLASLPPAFRAARIDAIIREE